MATALEFNGQKASASGSRGTSMLAVGRLAIRQPTASSCMLVGDACLPACLPVCISACTHVLRVNLRAGILIWSAYKQPSVSQAVTKKLLPLTGCCG